MHGTRSRRGSTAARVGVALLILAGCHGGSGGTALTPTADTIDVKSACAALAQLRLSSETLQGVDVGDPDASLAALQKAVDAYSASLGAFERVAPLSLRARAEVVRTAVIAHQFAKAAAQRATIDVWANRNCTS
jgi:hypothetical protein